MNEFRDSRGNTRGGLGKFNLPWNANPTSGTCTSASGCLDIGRFMYSTCTTCYDSQSYGPSHLEQVLLLPNLIAGQSVRDIKWYHSLIYTRAFCHHDYINLQRDATCICIMFAFERRLRHQLVAFCIG